MARGVTVEAQGGDQLAALAIAQQQLITQQRQLTAQQQHNDQQQQIIALQKQEIAQKEQLIALRNQEYEFIELLVTRINELVHANTVLRADVDRLTDRMDGVSIAER